MLSVLWFALDRMGVCEGYEDMFVRSGGSVVVIAYRVEASRGICRSVYHDSKTVDTLIDEFI